MVRNTNHEIRRGATHRTSRNGKFETLISRFWNSYFIYIHYLSYVLRSCLPSLYQLFFPSVLNLVTAMAGNDGYDWQYYRYNPSLAAAAIFIVLFLSTTTFHLYQLIRTRTWYFIPLVVGGFCELPSVSRYALRD